MDTAEHLYSGIEKELSEHGVYATNTSGVSMRPLFKTHRDVVVIKKAEGELKKYDVVLYRSYTNGEHVYVLHRIIGVKDDAYVIRGDNTYVKEYVPKEAVLGVMISFNRKGKRHTVDESGYKAYSRIWNFIYPIRALYAKCRRFAGRVYRKLFKRRRKPSV